MIDYDDLLVVCPEELPTPSGEGPEGRAHDCDVGVQRGEHTIGVRAAVGKRDGDLVVEEHKDLDPLACLALQELVEPPPPVHVSVRKALQVHLGRDEPSCYEDCVLGLVQRVGYSIKVRTPRREPAGIAPLAWGGVRLEGIRVREGRPLNRLLDCCEPALEHDLVRCTQHEPPRRPLDQQRPPGAVHAPYLAVAPKEKHATHVELPRGAEAEKERGPQHKPAVTLSSLPAHACTDCGGHAARSPPALHELQRPLHELWAEPREIGGGADLEEPREGVARLHIRDDGNGVEVFLENRHDLLP
mmetsp:Transcript_29769/g.73319  ORF Transcript_29769/g.73319 Transcript_29769/m.73319 type:complete len:301 (-) Transcript_29769:61-963(-)|eukprot:CAMPEP_0206248188 /NCGR_PEP_ID=MMETSP0047_2-20121206/20234_1 /ASSEMBLY_ACC=CAM_ASM_000192 /TAXON_ID=195065 /ORGANISM="Chroomonas mesostigmatica_cf, Strain CCMP1168" /LENGTH=300 /DNA_ID=CAMNT_0053673811 /DNA_START=290 /DNA_END=1192 /DNA_ORIENTATION=+